MVGYVVDCNSQVKVQLMYEVKNKILKPQLHAPITKLSIIGKLCFQNWIRHEYI